MGNKDSLHIASAISAKCNYFITVDKGILKKNQVIDYIDVVDPIEFIDICEGCLHEK